MSNPRDEKTMMPAGSGSTGEGSSVRDAATILPGAGMAASHAPGDVVDNRYTVVREIGRGGMGVVVEVSDNLTRDSFALKRLHPALASRPEVEALLILAVLK